MVDKDYKNFLVLMLKVKCHHQGNGIWYRLVYHLCSTANKIQVSYHALVFVCLLDVRNDDWVVLNWLHCTPLRSRGLSYKVMQV